MEPGAHSQPGVAARRSIGNTLEWFSLPQEGREHVEQILVGEERRYKGLRERGHKIVEHRLRRGPLSEDDYRDLYETNGLPRELVEELVSGQS